MEITGISQSIVVFRASSFLGALLSCLCFFCCSQNNQDRTDVKVYYPLENTQLTTDLAPYIEESELIPMSSDSISLSGITKMLITDNMFFFLAGGAVFSMLKTGGEIRRIGNFGRGPGEYILIKDISLNLKRTELWCMDALNTLLIYDSCNGCFLRKMDVADINMGYARAILPLRDDTFALYVPNPPTKDLIKEKVSFYCLRVFDSNGREVDKMLPWDDYHINASFSVPVSFSDDNTSVLAPEISCPCVVYVNGKEKRKVFFDFGRKNVPYRYLFQQGNDPMEMLGTLFENDYYKLISYVFFVRENIYFRAFGKDSSLWNFYFSEYDSMGIRWKSVGGLLPPISAIGTEDGYLFFLYEDVDQISGEEQDPLKKYIFDRYGASTLSSSGDSFLIKVKLNV